jgi:hypothetical protein
MYPTVFWFMVGCSSPHMMLITGEPPQVVPGFNERLNQALGGDGGVQVYQDAAGNVGTVIDPPGGARRFTVQPPQSPSMNVGPPLQLSPPAATLPPAATPSPPPPPDFPHKAR